MDLARSSDEGFAGGCIETLGFLECLIRCRGATVTPNAGRHGYEQHRQQYAHADGASCCLDPLAPRCWRVSASPNSGDAEAPTATPDDATHNRRGSKQSHRDDWRHAFTLTGRRSHHRVRVPRDDRAAKNESNRRSKNHGRQPPPTTIAAVCAIVTMTTVMVIASNAAANDSVRADWLDRSISAGDGPCRDKKRLTCPESA